MILGLLLRRVSRVSASAWGCGRTYWVGWASTRTSSASSCESPRENEGISRRLYGISNSYFKIDGSQEYKGEYKGDIMAVYHLLHIGELIKNSHKLIKSNVPPVGGRYRMLVPPNPYQLSRKRHLGALLGDYHPTAKNNWS